METKKLFWFVLYIYPKSEFIVKRELSMRNYECFLPEIEVINVWKNRQKKIIKKPLFPSYIFVKTHHRELYNLIKIPKICYFLTTGNEASTVPEHQIETIKHTINNRKDFFLDNIDNAFNRKVIVLSGPCKGIIGVLVTQKGKKFIGIDMDFANKRFWINIENNIVKAL